MSIEPYDILLLQYLYIYIQRYTIRIFTQKKNVSNSLVYGIPILFICILLVRFFSFGKCLIVNTDIYTTFRRKVEMEFLYVLKKNKYTAFR